MSQLQEQDPARVIPYRNDTFAVGFDQLLALLFTMSEDKAARVTLQQDGETFEAKHKPSNGESARRT